MTAPIKDTKSALTIVFQAASKEWPTVERRVLPLAMSSLRCS